MVTNINSSSWFFMTVLLNLNDNLNVFFFNIFTFKSLFAYAEISGFASVKELRIGLNSNLPG